MKPTQSLLIAALFVLGWATQATAATKTPTAAIKTPLEVTYYYLPG